MLVKTEIARIYDTVLSIPGMNDNVKIAPKIPRKNVLRNNQLLTGPNTLVQAMPFRQGFSFYKSNVH
ncbi:MAG: hypothetical protein JWQ09_3119 [Segetibacter sp.]|nr:hypothetical protein [Segetibacter sp.]